MTKKKEENGKGEVSNNEAPVGAAEVNTQMVKATSPYAKSLELVRAALTPSEQARLQVALTTVPENLGSNVERLLAVMNPNKKGIEPGSGATWSPVQVRVYQPVSTKDIPPGTKMGELYTDAGAVLPQPFRFVPICVYATHAKFEQDSASPACVSDDTKVSTTGISCADCPDLPFRDGKRTMCSKVLNVLAFGEDFNNVYRLSFAKTSYKAGAKLLTLLKTSAFIWENWFELVTVETPRGQGQPGKYYVLNVLPTNKPVDQGMFNIIDLFSDWVKTIREAFLKERSVRRTVVTEAVHKGVTEPPKTGNMGAPPVGVEPDFDDGSL